MNERGPWSRSRANLSLKSNTVIKAAYIGGLRHPQRSPLLKQSCPSWSRSRTRVSVGENESVSEKFCQSFALSSEWNVGHSDIIPSLAGNVRIARDLPGTMCWT